MKNDENYDSEDDLDVIKFAILTVYIVHYVCHIEFACFNSFDAKIFQIKGNLIRKMPRKIKIFALR